MGLYLVRVTPLSYVCSPVHTLTVIKRKYAANSFTALVRLDVMARDSSAARRARLLARMTNSQDARGWLSHSGLHSALWVLHNTEVNATGGRQLTRMELVKYRLSFDISSDHASPLREAHTARLISRVVLEPDFAQRQQEKNWQLLRAAPGAGHGGTALLSYSLRPHIVLHCALATGRCTRAYNSSSSEL